MSPFGTNWSGTPQLYKTVDQSTGDVNYFFDYPPEYAAAKAEQGAPNYYAATSGRGVPGVTSGGPAAMRDLESEWNYAFPDTPFPGLDTAAPVGSFNGMEMTERGNAGHGSWMDQQGGEIVGDVLYGGAGYVGGPVAAAMLGAGSDNSAESKRNMRAAGLGTLAASVTGSPSTSGSNVSDAGNTDYGATSNATTADSGASNTSAGNTSTNGGSTTGNTSGGSTVDTTSGNTASTNANTSGSSGSVTASDIAKLAPLALSLYNGSSGGAGAGATDASGAAKTAAQISEDQWNYYKSQYQPLESNLIAQAQAAGSPAEFARARGAANADVTGAFDTARKNTLNRMQSYGINPGSPAFQNAAASTDIAEGATKAGALTAADNNTRNLAYSKALDVVGLGKGIPAQSAASAANASRAATAASNERFAQNTANMKNTGYGLNTLGAVADKWFGSNTSNQNQNQNYTVASPTTYGDTYSTTDPAYGASGGKVSRYGIGYAEGGEVGKRVAVGRIRNADGSIRRTDADEQIRAAGERAESGGAMRGPKVITPQYAQGGAVIDAERTGPGQYDATTLKGVLQKRGLSDANAHAESSKATMRHKGAITPHMRHFAVGGGVGRQGLEGPDASNMGELQGPGTETSDSIPATIDGQQPAALSTGEVVMNAEVPKLSGEEIMQAINEAGLKKRQQSGIEPQTSAQIPPNAGMQAYRRGGMVSRYGMGA